jgi:hypothetical protein
MATDKKFTVAGVSTKDGKTKIRFASDAMRIKILDKNGHIDVELIDLPGPMTKGEIAAYMMEVDFANGREEVAAAIAYIAKKNPLSSEANDALRTLDDTEIKLDIFS